MTSKFVFTTQFERGIKQLKKHYRNIASDIELALESLESNPELGAIIPDDYQVRKLRVASRDMKRGKSGGFRLLCKLEATDEDIVLIYLLFTYAKTDQEDISIHQLKDFIDDLESDSDEA